MIAMQAMTNPFTQDAILEERSQLAEEWMDAQSENSSIVAGADGQGARAAETDRLAPGGQDREEERLSDVQTSQIVYDPRELELPFAQHYRTSQDFYDDGRLPLQPLCD
jgi:hypothetical protein